MDSNSVLDIFRQITLIPRESGHEEKMTAFLVDFALKHNLEHKADSTGNVMIARAAAPGKEGVPTLVLQSHQDMVCEKLASSTHDFSKDPIPYVIEDGWMISKETTLGADDGIGVAASLALLESSLEMGRIECIFTISEETGMDGAFAMEEGFFSGKTLINLDSEDEGQLFIGCAGGLDTAATFEYTPQAVKEGYTVLSLHLGGGIGGHSGDDINKDRANAVQLLARFLYHEWCESWQLVTFSGGNKYNAIAREALACLAIPAAEAKEVEEAFAEFQSTLRTEFCTTDPGLFCSCAPAQASKAIESGVPHRLLSALVSVHHGVKSMSQTIPGLVQTSSNLAFVKMEEEGKIVVGTSQRSSSESEKEAVADRVEACFRLAGARTRRFGAYPGWDPDIHSHVLARTVESYRRLFNQEPEVKAIHAGLECGLFLKKFPGLDMISFGPTLRGVHAPGEKLDLASNEKFVALLVDLVCNFQ